MTALLAALAAAAVLGGLLMVAAGLQRVPEVELAARPPSPRVTRLQAFVNTSLVEGPGVQRRRVQLGVAIGGGMLAFLITGLALMVIAIPVAVLGLPKLLSPPASAADVERLEALETWTRSLSGVLVGGLTLEHALTASLHSTPTPIRPQVDTLVARLASGWQTEAALRAFANDLNDSTGDLVSASLVLAARRRGSGLAAVLSGLAVSVGEDVRARRQIEADRAKPRSTARAVTLLTLVVLALLALNRSYVEPYTSPAGQLLLAAMLSAYVAALLWMRQMTAGAPTPRFLTATTGPGSEPVEAVQPVQALLDAPAGRSDVTGVRW